MFKSSRERVIWLAITVLLGLELRFDRLSVLERVYKSTFQADSDSLITTTMMDADRGFLDPMLQAAGGDYNSQFGLHGIVMEALSPGAALYGPMRLLTSFFAAAVLATAVVACWRAVGGRAAVVLLALFTLSPWLNAYGASTYWQLWTLLLPILLVLLVWPRLGDGRRKWLRGTALIASLVFFRALCGYEFMSTIVIGIAAAVAFHEFRGRVDRTLLVKLGATMTAGVVGFVAALGLHMLQLTIKYGNAASVLTERVGERTFSPSTLNVMLGWARDQQDPSRSWLVREDSMVGLWGFQMVGYLRDPAIALPAPEFAGFGLLPYGVPIWVFVVLFGILAWQAVRGRGPNPQLQRRLALSAGLGLIGALSWLILAYGHMIHHPHLNAIVFYLPFLPFVFAMIALRVQAFWLRVWPSKRHAGEVPPEASPEHRDEALVLTGVPGR
jgi:hypothetical protein